MQISRLAIEPGGMDRPATPPENVLRSAVDGGQRVASSGAERRVRPASRFSPAAELRSIAAAKGICFGTALPPADKLAADPAYAALLRREAAIYVADTDMQPSRIQGVEGVFTFTAADGFAARAVSENKKFRIHQLLYAVRDMAWVNTTTVNAENWRNKIDTHFAAIATRWWSQLAVNIDVVNEVMDAAQIATDGYRPNTWYQAAGGPGYITYAFQKARELWPQTPLFVCHDHSEQITDGYHESHTANILSMLESQLAAGAPIDGLNTQAHLTIRLGFDAVKLRSFLSDASSLGLKIMIGELDIRTGYKTGSQEDTAPPSAYSATSYDRRAADIVKHYLDIALPFVGSEPVLCWGLSDRISPWIPPDAEEGERPHPFDTNLQPKPLYRAIRAAFEDL
ncbi:endo-1,4-beta-xylanase [Pararhizobium arenae]|uniref:endo-1,4-beta-xylanase n=1 Tax=Pararhizobium arenae TaxID=1856850 RepID=UPI000AA2DAA8|nr:endo-1,4-beta-xylanase [Pararhizobium arenae]